MNIEKKNLLRERSKVFAFLVHFPLSFHVLRLMVRCLNHHCVFFHYREIKGCSLKFNFIVFEFLIMGDCFTGRDANLLEILPLGTNNNFKEPNFATRRLCYHFQVDSKELIM